MDRNLRDVVDLTMLKRGALLLKNPAMLLLPPETNNDSSHQMHESDNDAGTNLTSPDVHDGRIAQTPMNTYDASSSEQANGMPIAPNLPTPIDDNLLPEDKIRTHIEHDALEREEDRKRSSLTKPLVITLAACALGAIVQ